MRKILITVLAAAVGLIPFEAAFGNLTSQLGSLLSGGTNLSLDSMLEQLDPALAALFRDAGIDEQAVLSLLLREPAWPDDLENTVAPIDDPDISVRLAASYVDTIFSALTAESLPLDMAGGGNGGSISFAESRLLLSSPMTPSNVMAIKVSGGALQSGSGVAVQLNHATVQVAPALRVDGERLFLDFKARLTRIVIEGVPEKYCKMLTMLLVEKTDTTPIASMELTGYVTLTKTVNLLGHERAISIVPERTAVTLDDGGILVAASFAEGGAQ